MGSLSIARFPRKEPRSPGAPPVSGASSLEVRGRLPRKQAASREAPEHIRGFYDSPIKIGRTCSEVGALHKKNPGDESEEGLFPLSLVASSHRDLSHGEGPAPSLLCKVLGQRHPVTTSPSLRIMALPSRAYAQGRVNRASVSICSIFAESGVAVSVPSISLSLIIHGRFSPRLSS
jgi:hypothetical protein